MFSQNTARGIAYNVFKLEIIQKLRPAFPKMLVARCDFKNMFSL